MEKAQQLRGKALRSRVMIANALCSIVESDMHNGMKERAVASLKAIRRSVEEIAVLASEPNHISATVSRELSEFLSELEERIRTIEAIVGRAD